MPESLLDTLKVFTAEENDADNPGLIAKKEELIYEENLKADAYAEGYDAAVQEIADNKAAEEQRLRTISESLHSQLETSVEAIERSHANVFLQLLSAVMPELAKSQRAEEVLAIIKEAAKGHLGGEITIRANEKVSEELELMIAAMNTQRQFTIEQNDYAEDDKVELSWGKGGATIDIEGTINKCLEKLMTEHSVDDGECHAS